MKQFRDSIALAAFALIVGGAQALAHPHVWVKARTQVLFDEHGRVRALRQEWTFDEMYSAFQVQGLAKKGELATKEELAPLAAEQMKQLMEFGYFTFPKVAGHAAKVGAPVDPVLEEGADKLVTLRFTLPLAEPASAKVAFTFQVYDPTYFVDFSFADDKAVSMERAPKGCSASVVEPPPLNGDDLKVKDESFYTGLPPGADIGAKLASRAVVACPR